MDTAPRPSFPPAEPASSTTGLTNGPRPDLSPEMDARLGVIERLLLRMLDRLDRLPEPLTSMPEPLPPSGLLGGPPAPSSGLIPPPPLGERGRFAHDNVKDPPDPTWIPVLHVGTTQQPGCRWPALYLTRPFSTTEKADLTAMRTCPPGEAAWRQPTVREIAVCSGCGAPVDPVTDKDLDYRAVLVPTPEITRRPRPSHPPRSRSGSAAHTDVRPMTGSASVPGRVSPSIPPGYSPEAALEVVQHLDSLRKIAQDAGLNPEGIS